MGKIEFESELGAAIGPFLLVGMAALIVVLLVAMHRSQRNRKQD